MKPDDLATCPAQAMRHVRHIHFVGIGGAGMCGIAEVMANLGYTVSGSDIVPSNVTARLASLGIVVSSQHRGSNIEDADVVVRSSAIADDNPEVVSAHALHKPVVPRAEMLGELMRHRYGIAVAGSHGKTTATSFIADIFQAANMDPTYVIGGLLKSDNRNAKLGSSRYIIAEADESDASFLYLHPMLAVITNIDHDHLGTYGQDFEQLRQAFRDFVSKLPFYGAVILCIDDEECRRFADEISRPVITYGLSDEADYQAVDIEATGVEWRFNVKRPNDQTLLPIETQLPGTQNVQNALAAIAVASDEGIADTHIQEGIRRFIGVDRRFEVSEITLNNHRLPLVDDYGHHPTELACTIETVKRVWPHKRQLMVYQPHRFTRTRDLFKEFTEVLRMPDDLIILDTYAASEKSIVGAGALDLCQAINAGNASHVTFTKHVQEVVEWINATAEADHVVMVQGAGDVSRVSDLLKSS
ncbi:MAG: UDP-N-acetylmuramate--L-alanine ligase [Gammaproteobacteria bacterium]|nr:UDP-N-acetylmuramate--L-alanine ligase [Gammaproteobacteria bacterium]